MQSLDCLGRASKEGTINSWWPREMHDHREQKHHDEFIINAHPETVLGQNWVNCQVWYC